MYFYLMNFRFPKSEKLKSRKTIEKLFLEGSSFTKFPVKVLFLSDESLENTQATFAVPKRNFKLAVARNRIKRQLRELYRLQKQEVLKNNGKKFALLFLYIGKEKPLPGQLQNAMAVLLKKFNDETI